MNARHLVLLLATGAALAPTPVFTVSGGEPPAAQRRGYKKFSVAVYFRYQEVHSIPGSLDRFSTHWADAARLQPARRQRKT